VEHFYPRVDGIAWFLPSGFALCFLAPGKRLMYSKLIMMDATQGKRIVFQVSSLLVPLLVCLLFTDQIMSAQAFSRRQHPAHNYNNNPHHIVPVQRHRSTVVSVSVPIPSASQQIPQVCHKI